MGCHFCANEVIAIFTVIASCKLLPAWIRGIWGRRHQKPSCCHASGHKVVDTSTAS